MITPILPPSPRTGSTMPSSSSPTVRAPHPFRVERNWTERLAMLTVGIAVGDALIHLLVWVLQ